MVTITTTAKLQQFHFVYQIGKNLAIMALCQIQYVKSIPENCDPTNQDEVHYNDIFIISEYYEIDDVN